MSKALRLYVLLEISLQRGPCAFPYFIVCTNRHESLIIWGLTTAFKGCIFLACACVCSTCTFYVGIQCPKPANIELVERTLQDHVGFAAHEPAHHLE